MPHVVHAQKQVWVSRATVRTRRDKLSRSHGCKDFELASDPQQGNNKYLLTNISDFLGGESGVY